MPNITATEAKRRFGATIDAAQRDPVFISKNGKQAAVMISFDAFVRLTGVDRRKPNPKLMKLFKEQLVRRADLFRALKE